MTEAAATGGTRRSRFRTGAPRPWGYRLYKVSVPSAAVICLPLMLAMAWYTWSAYAQFDRYRRASGTNEKLDTELFHIFVHDELDKDIRRMLLPERPEPGAIPTFELSVGRQALAGLAPDPVVDGKRAYVNALIRKDGRMHDGRVRYRGRRHWHWLQPQKSMKVRIDKGDLLDGVRVFNLLNDVTPFGLEEEIVLDVAREQGLLTPEYHPVRVRLNGADMGVYRYEAQPAEGLIRRARRMPGSIYSGNSSAKGPQTGVGALFANLAGWRKTASRTPDLEQDFGELARLLRAVREMSHAELREFARDEMDLDRFALFDALDVVFGGAQHDFLSNHKFYFDAYRGRFEPVAWSFRAFTNDPMVNLVENPLLLRLKATSVYAWRRDRAVYRLITTVASAPAIRDSVNRRFEQLLPELESDPYWDAYKLLTRASRFHRFMVRPMTAGRWLMASQAELDTYGRRNRFLLDTLESSGLDVRSYRAADRVLVIELTVSGHAAYRLRDLTLVSDGEGDIEIRADADLDGVLDVGRDPLVAAGATDTTLALQRYAQLLPGVALVERAEGRDKHGTVMSVRVPRTYRYFATWTEAAPVRGWVEVEGLVTEASSRHHLRIEEGHATKASDTVQTASAAAVPRLAAGEASPHPWVFGPDPLPQEVRLGPGVVSLPEGRVFGRHETVHVAAGTRIELGPAASLVFEGPVFAHGEASAEVEIAAADPTRPFGGILLRGPGTAGSRLRHVAITGGTHPRYLAVHAPSLLNIYDTSDVALEDVTATGIEETEDVIHATYVDDLRLYEITIVDAPIDAIDLEFSKAVLRGVRVVRPGDECLDIMGSEVRLVDSLLLGCTNSAVSAGEETEIALHGVVIAGSKVGVLAKNASSARVSRSLIYDTQTALRTNRRDVHYNAPSGIVAHDVYAVDCDKPTKRAKGTRIEAHGLHTTLPEPGRLDRLEGQVLGLSDWDDLDDRLRDLADLADRGRGLADGATR